MAVAVLRGLGAGLGFIVTVMLGRKLGVAGLGEYAFAITVVAVLAIPVSYGCGTTLLRVGSAACNSGVWAETKGLAVWSVCLAFVAPALLLLAYLSYKFLVPGHQIVGGISLPIVSLLAAVLLFDQLAALRSVMLRAVDKPLLAQMPEMLVRPLCLITMILLVDQWSQGNLQLIHAMFAIAFAALSAMLTGRIMALRALPDDYYRSSPEYRPNEWLISSSHVTLSSGLVVVNSYAAILVLGLLVDTRDVGIFRVSVQVSLISSLVYSSLGILASQRFGFYIAAGRWDSVQSAATSMARIGMLFSLPLPIVLLLAGQAIVPFVFGVEYDEAVMPMVVLTIGQIAIAGTGMAQPLLLMSGLESLVSRWTALSLGANVSLCIVFVPIYGALGAAIASTVSSVIWKFALWRVARKQIEIDTSIV